MGGEVIGGKTISSVLEMLNLGKRWDIQEETAERQLEIRVRREGEMSVEER